MTPIATAAAPVILAIVFPDIDPVAVHIGPLAIRWYALAYITGFLLGWRYCLRLSDRTKGLLTRVQIDDFLFWVIVAVILGGRLGYVLVYNPGFYFANPLEIFAVWRGGMSFHGGFLGVLAAMYLYARQHKVPFLALSDLVAPVTPIGLFFGRIANFINGELYGRATDVPWGVVFPGAGPDPRHPSQLYEAGLEGVLLFVLLWVLAVPLRGLERRGLLTGAFLAGYGVSRVVAELFRQPDVQIGFIAGYLTMGEILSVPLVIAGAWLLWRVLKPAP
ncbi:MAG: prolipoprotein diacylglyceryl transferase [Alphaproteobacteria bacterium]